MPYYGQTVDVMSYNMTCQRDKCADMQNPYIFESVFYNDTILINQFCIDFSTILNQMLPTILPLLPFTIPEIVILFIVPQLNVFHMSWMEVMARSNPLSANQVAQIKDFADHFPNSNIGYSMTWMDFFAKYFISTGNLNYEFDQLLPIEQDPTICV